MSEKIREFTEIPQQFIREGNQVCFSYHRLSCKALNHVLAAVSDTLHEANEERSLHELPWSFRYLLMHGVDEQSSLRSAGLLLLALR